MEKVIYADNAATTAVSKTVLESMMPFFCESFGNPSTVYSVGRSARVGLDKAREQVAKGLGAEAGQIYFTSCATEANNWAIRGAAYRQKRMSGKNHIITSAIEHHAVLHTVEALEKDGFTVTVLPVDSKGLISLQELEEAILPETVLVSIMLANNEIGTIQPIKEIGKICTAHKVLFHTDAVQGVGNIEIDVKDLNVDMMSISGHKFHAPKGVGALYIKKGVVIDNFLTGGAQEKGKRGGTENLASIVGMGKAMEEITADVEKRRKHLKSLTDYCKTEMLKIPKTRLNGHETLRLPGNLNFSFEGIEGEALLLMLDAKGLCASSGSACTSGSLDPSHVLMAIGLEHMVAHGSLRLSFTESNTMEEVKRIVEMVPPVIELLRSMSPVWEDIKNK